MKLDTNFEFLLILLYTEMDNNSQQPAINGLPEEMLLAIFRQVSMSDFLLLLPLVYRRWKNVMASDKFTVKHIGMVYFITKPFGVQFFFAENEDDLFRYEPHDYNDLFSYNCTKPINYDIVYNMFTKYPELYEEINILVISKSLNEHPTNEFTCVNNLTTLVFFHMVFENEENLNMLEKLSKKLTFVKNLSYIECQSTCPSLVTRLMYSNFKRLERFRMDCFPINHLDFLDILSIHGSSLKTIEFDYVHPNLDDKWLDVMTNKLKGRTILNLRMHKIKITYERFKEFIKSDLITGESKVIIEDPEVNNDDESEEEMDYEGDCENIDIDYSIFDDDENYKLRSLFSLTLG